MNDVVFLPIERLSTLLAQGSLSAVELTRAYLDRIERLDESLNAYAHVHAEQALALAACSDQRRRAGLSLGPLDGIPIAVKDLCDIAGQPMRAGSRILSDNVAKDTAPAIRRLLAAGAVILGSTHMVEFAFGAWGINPMLGTPRNPWDLAVHRVPGGSSSGSAVAVAAGLAAAAIGSDTGGSIRNPSLLNGLTGLKVTAGRISLAGCLELSYTLDTLGPIARSAWDAALLTEVMQGTDVADPRTQCAQTGPLLPAPFSSGAPLAGMSVAVLPAGQRPASLDAPFAQAYEQTAARLAELGAVVLEPANLPFDFAEMTTMVGQIIAAEGYALYSHYADDPAAPMGESVRTRLQGGASISGRDYLRLVARHRQAKAQWREWMAEYDALLVPGVPVTAPALAEVDESSLALSLYTRPANFLGTCALALPAGFDEHGLPLGVQLYGKPWGEAALARLGCALQSTTDWHLRHPAI